MDPLTAAMALGQFVPQIVKWMTGSNKAESVAEKVVAIAKQVTGKESPEDAVESLKADPNLVLAFRESVLAQEVSLEKLAAEANKDVNETMREEGKSEHWAQYTWRPTIGFAVALNVAITSLTVGAAYVGVIFFEKKPESLSHLPAMLGAMAALIGVVSPILGIASWFRGKSKLDTQ